MPVFFVVIIIGFLLSFSNTVYATSNLLSNPGFENGTNEDADNWTESGAAQRQGWANHTGSWGMATVSWVDNGVGNAYQTVSATASTEYTFSLAVRADDADHTAYMKLTWLESDDTEISSDSHCITTTTSWAQETLTATAPTDTAKVKVEFGSTTGGTTIKFDDATLMAVAADTYVWDGGGANSNFSTRENWVSNFAPGSGDSVLFDNTSNNCTLDGPYLGDGDFEMTSGYSGTISSSGNTTVDAADLDLTNATWSITDEFTTGGGDDTGALTITAGTLTTSDALWISGNVTLSGDASINQTGAWTVVRGQTTKTISNSGTGSITFAKLEENSDTSAEGEGDSFQTTINCDVTVTGDVIVNNDSGGQTDDGKLILTDGSTLDIGGKFENKGSFTSDDSGNTVQVAGNIDLTDTLTWGFSDSGTFEWDGTGTNYIYTQSTYNSINNLTVSGSGTLYSASSSTGALQVSSNYSQSAGTFIVNYDGMTVSGTTSITGGTMQFNKNATLTGNVTNSSTMKLNRGFASATLTIGSGSELDNSSGTFQIIDTESADNTVTLQGNSGQFTFTGTDIDYNGESVTLKYIDYDPDVVLDAAGDAIVLGDSDCVFDAIAVGSGGVAATFNAGANNFEVSGNFSVDSTATLTTSGTATFSGTSGTQTITSGGKSFSSVTINNSGTSVQIQDAIDVDGNFRLQSGTFDCNSQNQNFAGNFQLDAATTYTKGGTLTFDGTTTFTDNATQNIGIVTISGSVTEATALTADSLTVSDENSVTTAGYDIDLSGALTVNGTGTLDASDNGGGSSNIQIGTNLDIADTATFTKGSSTLTFDGTTDDCTIDTGGSAFNNVTVSKTDSADTVTVQNDALDIDGNLTITEGEFVLQTSSNFGDATSDSVDIEAGGTLTSTTGGITVTFFAGSTTTIADDSTAKFIFTGGSGNLIILKSSSDTTQWKLSRGASADTSGTDYLDVRDSDASLAATMSAGTNSTGASDNNTNWVFDGTKIWVGGGTDTNFLTADNWQHDTAPTTGDNVLFSYGSNNCDLEHFDMEDGDFEMTSGYSGTVNWGGPGRFEADKVTLDLTNATWSIADEFRSGQGNDTGALTITAGTFTTSNVLYCSGNITLSGTGSINQTSEYTLMDGTAAKTITKGAGTITFAKLGEISYSTGSTTINCDVTVTGDVEINDFDVSGEGDLTLKQDRTLDIGGNFTNKGSFTSESNSTVQVAGSITLRDSANHYTSGFDVSGTFEWDGTAYAEIVGNASEDLSDFQDLIVSSSDELKVTWDADGPVYVDGNFSQSNGTFDIDYPGFTVSGTTSITGGTMKFFKNATLTGAVTNSSTMHLHGQWDTVTVSLGTSLTNSGTVQVTNDDNAITLQGDGAQKTFSGTDIDYNGNSITLKYIDYDPDITLATGETIVIGDYNFNVGGNWSNSGSFTQGTSTVIFNGAGQSISGTTTFYGLNKTVTSADTLTFEHSQTQTVSNSLTLKGASGNLLSIRSSSNGTQALLTLDSGSQDLEYLDVKDNDASGGDTLAAGSTSTNSGNNDNWTFAIVSVNLRNYEDTEDYTTWSIGSGKETDTVYTMGTNEAVLVKNNGNVAEDFSLEANGTNWTFDSSTGEDQCVLMGLFNADTAPTSDNYNVTYDLIDGTTRWATESAGNGIYEGASDGDNVTAGTGEELYIYLKTPSSLTTGDQETITVTVGAREH
jgi:hypothetical protein